MSVRLRFAPSPTGYMHVGNLRTVLFDYLYAKGQGGKLILRIEDTDRTRLTEGAVENLIENMTWAGIEIDEGPHKGGEYGPYVQSERLPIYQQYAKQLIDEKKAYVAFDSREALQAMRQKQEKEKVPVIKYLRNEMMNSLTLPAEEVEAKLAAGEPHVVRLFVPEDRTSFVFDDLVRGKVEFGRDNIDDQILLKEDGFPTYHLAVVVDDYLMKISHIVRGEEWLSSVPKHILLHEYFGWDFPKTAHVPLMLHPSGKKMSKRDTGMSAEEMKAKGIVHVSVEDYRKQGYEPEAFINFLAMQGWSPGGDDVQEVMALDEIASKFDFSGVNNSGAKFDVEKLKWFNKQYVQKLPEDQLVAKLKAQFDDSPYQAPSQAVLAKLAMLFKERVTFIKEIPEASYYFFETPRSYNAKAVKKKWKESTPSLLEEFMQQVEQLDDFSAVSIKSCLEEFCAQKDVKLGAVMPGLRLVLTGEAGGPDLMETMVLLGKETCKQRVSDGTLKINELKSQG